MNNSAEYPTIAQVNAPTKSGTNQWHGNAVEYYKSSVLQSRNPFVPSHISGVMYEWAVGMGGPIKRDKAFFYGACSGSRIHGPVSVLATVPTPAMRSGDFSAFSSPGVDPTTGQPFQGNVIPSDQISPVSTVFINRFYPMPNSGDPNVYAGANYRSQVTQMPAEDSAFVRFDYDISNKHSFYANFLIDEGNRNGIFTGSLPTVGFRLGYRRAQTATFSDTYTFNPHLVNQFIVGYSRDGNFIYGQTYGPDVEKILGLQGINAIPVAAIPSMSISGFTGVHQQSYDPYRDQVYTVYGDIAYIKGRHRLKFGILYMHGSNSGPAFTSDAFYGTFSFDGFATGGAGTPVNSFADFPLEIPRSSLVDNGNFFNLYYRANQSLVFYGQDTFQATAKLTLNFGLRYEYHSPFVTKHGLASTFDLQTQTIIVQNQHSTDLINPLLSSQFQFKTAQQAGYPSSLVSFGELNWAPRFSFAYRITPTLVVRGGYGILYDFVPPVTRHLSPFIPSESFPPNQLVNGSPLYQFPDPFPPTPITGVGVGSLSVGGYVRHMKFPYTQQWGLSVERQFKWDMALRLSYIGNHSVDAPYTKNINLPLPSTIAFTHSGVPLPLFGPVTMSASGANSNYEALEARVVHQGRVGLFFSSSFDWAKSLSETGLSVNGSTLDPFNRVLDYGNVSYQPRLRSVTVLNWLIPVGSGRRYGSSWRGALKWVLGGWHTSNIFTASTGDHLTPSYSGYDSSGLGIFGERPDPIGDPNVSNPTMAEWFNPSAFAIPGASAGSPLTAPSAPIGRFGTAGVGIISGSGYWQDDWGLIKHVRATKRVSLNFFFLATNIFNHINPLYPSMNISNPGRVGKIFDIRSNYGSRFGAGTQGGRVLTMAEMREGIGPRAFQLGVRIDF